MSRGVSVDRLPARQQAIVQYFPPRAAGCDKREKRGAVILRIGRRYCRCANTPQDLRIRHRI